MNRFSDFANTTGGTFFVLIVAALFEVGGDWLVNHGVQGSSGSTRVQWVVTGVVALAIYSIFLNSAKIPFETLLGFYVIFFVLASQIIPMIRDRRLPSGITCIGIGLITIGSFVIRSQAK